MFLFPQYGVDIVHVNNLCIMIYDENNIEMKQEIQKLKNNETITKSCCTMYKILKC